MTANTNGRVEGHGPKYLRVRNWERYQLYKDGRPMLFFAVHVKSDPEKGRVGVFDDAEFMELADDPETPVFRIMAVAAQTGNKFPNSEKWLRNRVQTEYRVNIPKMLSFGFLEPCTDLYSVVPKKEKEKVLYVGGVVDNRRSWFRRAG